MTLDFIDEVRTHVLVYGIINHPDSDMIAEIPKEAGDAPGLIINVTVEAIKGCLASPSLIESFEAACRGESHHWKLVMVKFSDGQLHLLFANLEPSPQRNGCQVQGITITKNLEFEVIANRPGNDIPDKYEITYYGESSTPIAVIKKYRNGRRYATEVLHREGDGDHYALHSHRVE